MRHLWAQLICVLVIFIGLSESSEQDLDQIENLIDNFDEINSQSLQWGPYRSNLYMGVRPRIPDSFLSGLMWFSSNNFKSIQTFKHECKNADKISKFGWESYDPRYGGRERIKDEDTGLDLVIDFVKSDDGANWAIKIKGKAKSPKDINSLVYYFAVEESGFLELKTPYIDDTSSCVDPKRKIELGGFSNKLNGEFLIDIFESDLSGHPVKKRKNNDEDFNPYYTHHLPMTVPMDDVWQAKDIFWTIIKMNAQEMHKYSPKVVNDYSATEFFQLRNTQNFQGNTHFIQKTFKGDFEMDIIFNSKKSNNKINIKTLNDMIAQTSDKIHDKFISKFQLMEPFNEIKYINFAKETLSRLLGGIGYFHGNHLVDREVEIDDEKFTQAKLNGKSEGPFELFTCVPSRSFFPRGFYWDEGFHLLPILDYDSDLALEIVKSWFDLIDEDGWIAREQILGDEARSYVPEEFVTQNHNIANPPTLMIIFSKLFDDLNKFNIEKSQNDDQLNYNLDKKLGDLHILKPELLLDYAQDIYEELQSHYEWFRRTQRGEVDEFGRNYLDREEVYRWKGRTKDHCLPSGLDDYPRCTPDIGEINIDLMSWMAVMSRSMSQISKLLGKNEDNERYTKNYYGIVANINRQMWSDDEKSYCDLTIDDDDDEDVFVCHVGYVSLMPFIHQLIPSKATIPLMSSLGQIYNPKKLWTNYGIRSLSKDDAFFHKGEDYWRGNIWINMNYMILKSLLHYGENEEVDYDVRQLANEIYTKLRKNVVNNVFEEWQKTGQYWEQYNEMDGHGQRTKNFTGWTSLVILIMKMPERIF